LRPASSSGLPPPSGAAPRTLPSGNISLSPEARAHHLAQQLVQTRQDLASAQADLRNARSERDSLRAELSRARSRVEELETAQAGEPERLAAPQPSIDPDLELKLRGRINELEAALQNARTASVPPPAEASDLKVVRGIGPKFEKALKAEGVTGLRQIAEWSEADIDAVAQKLGIRPERIRKDDWVAQAKRALETA
jgi:predicted flap endonuclease-1-like 5' DNA nuclease